MEVFQILLLLRLLMFPSHDSYSISGCCLIKVFYVTIYPPGLLPQFLLQPSTLGRKKNYVTRSLAPIRKCVPDFQGSLAILCPHSVCSLVHSPQNCSRKSSHPPATASLQLPAFCPGIWVEIPQLLHLSCQNSSQKSPSLFSEEEMCQLLTRASPKSSGTTSAYP